MLHPISVGQQIVHSCLEYILMEMLKKNSLKYCLNTKNLNLCLIFFL